MTIVAIIGAIVFIPLFIFVVLSLASAAYISNFIDRVILNAHKLLGVGPDGDTEDEKG
jgi:hypothetical protein